MEETIQSKESCILYTQNCFTQKSGTKRWDISLDLQNGLRSLGILARRSTYTQGQAAAGAFLWASHPRAASLRSSGTSSVCPVIPNTAGGEALYRHVCENTRNRRVGIRLGGGMNIQTSDQNNRDARVRK